MDNYSIDLELMQPWNTQMRKLWKHAKHNVDAATAYAVLWNEMLSNKINDSERAEYRSEKVKYLNKRIRQTTQRIIRQLNKVSSFISNCHRVLIRVRSYR